MQQLRLQPQPIWDVNPAFHMNRSERIAFPVPVEFGDHVANTEVYKCGVDLAAGIPVSHPAI